MGWLIHSVVVVASANSEGINFTGMCMDLRSIFITSIIYLCLYFEVYKYIIP